MEHTNQAAWQGATTFGVAACLLVGLYIYYRQATSWRVVPINIPWFFDEAEKKVTTAPWSSQIGAHLSDFSNGINFVRTGYGKVSLLSTGTLAQRHSTADLCPNVVQQAG